MIIGTYCNGFSALRTWFGLGWNAFIIVRKMLQTNRFLCIFHVLAILPLNSHFSPGWNRLFTSFSASFWIDMSMVAFLKSFICIIKLKNAGWNEFLLSQPKTVFFREIFQKMWFFWSNMIMFTFHSTFQPSIMVKLKSTECRFGLKWCKEHITIIFQP